MERTVGQLVDDWIAARSKSDHTELAYRRTIAGWLEYCGEHGIDPIEARKGDVEGWHRMLAATPSARTGRPLKESSRAQMVAAVASFYDFLVDEDIVAAVPVRKSSRPKAPTESTTKGLSRDEAIEVQRRLDLESTIDRAIVLTLLLEGIRVWELITLNVGAMQFKESQIVLTIVGKGNKIREIVLADKVVEAIGQMLAERGDGDDTKVPAGEPLFTPGAGRRFSRQQVDRIVKRVCRAVRITGVSPHSLRHAFATNALDNGAQLHRVQHHLGHVSGDTTSRYDRARNAIHRSPVHQLAEYLTGAPS